MHGGHCCILLASASQSEIAVMVCIWLDACVVPGCSQHCCNMLVMLELAWPVGNALQRLIGIAGMLHLVRMPDERTVCMPMIAKLLLCAESHYWHGM
jgi:hypothetical protein